jgi:uncharacterized protein DUF4865
MYAKQYEITLPADYDMRIIRQRVSAAHHVLDDRAGLGLKAYLLRERARGGSPVNQYAPFYLWHDTAELARFLVGGAGFERIVRSFGRTSVHHWTAVATVAGPARAAVPTAASRRLTTIPEETDDTGTGLTRLIERDIEALDTLARREGVHTALLAVDPRDWRMVRFVLWEHAVPDDEDATEQYEVLHLSTPGLAEVPNGRHW